MIIDRLKNEIHPGTEIPKPEAKEIFSVKGWGMRRGEEALIYWIPNSKNPANPNQKGINVSEWRRAYNQLETSGMLTTEWFRNNLAACYNEGSCNFTSVGGIFSRLGIAEYKERGVYRKK